MAVTAHWIHTEVIQTATGPQFKLELHSALIAFQHLPGRHTAEHLTRAFLHVLDRLKITEKVCLVTALQLLLTILRSAGLLWTTLRTMLP
jgi:hypothetical protein